ncbi:hypothetical protein MTO96_026323 [Rhipicephalus appendiculatus]
MEIGPQGYNQVLPGLAVDGTTLRGLNELHQFGPAIPYCTNGSRMVQVDLYSDGHAYLSSAWKTFTGHEGYISIRPMLAQFTTQFRIVNTPPEDATYDFTDVTIDDDVFPRLIARLPEGIESGPQSYQSYLPGLQVGGLTAHGLSKLRQFGPAILYSTNEARMVQVDLLSEGDVQFWLPWKTCSGDQGRITVRAAFARFTFQFVIVESTDAGVELELHRFLPVTTQDVRIEVEGVGRAVRHTFEILSALLPSATKSFWNKEFKRNVIKAFSMMNE